MQLDSTVKTKWVEALRSGKYKQGRKALRTEDQFCCLGVECDLYDSTSWKGAPFRGHMEYQFLGRFGSLPTSLREAIGLSK